MASSMTRANAVSMFVKYYNRMKNINYYIHNAEAYQQFRETMADIMSFLTMVNTDGSYTIAFTEPRVTIVPYSNGIRPYKVKAGQAISYTIATTGGETTSTPVVFSAQNLPSWLTLNSSSGALTGTAPAVSTYTNNKSTGGTVANVTDIYPTALISAKNAFDEATNGPYPFVFQVTNTLAPNVTSAATGDGIHAGALTEYTVTADNTPTTFIAYGLEALNAGTGGTVAINPTTGVISGNCGSATTATTYTIYVAAINAYGEGVDKAVVFTLT